MDTGKFNIRRSLTPYTMQDKKKEYIICSAIWYDDGKVYGHQPKNITQGIVIAGRRHHNCIATCSILLGDKHDRTKITRANQGFLTNTNRYVGRSEGMVIAKNANQLINPDLHKMDNEAILTSEDLYSEDLY